MTADELLERGTPGICIFCLMPKGSPPWVRWKSGGGCQYGYACEYRPEEKARPRQARSVDANRCVHCGLHRKNPGSATADCAHEYPS